MLGQLCNIGPAGNILEGIDHYPYHPRNWIVYRFEFILRVQSKLKNLLEFHFYLS